MIYAYIPADATAIPSSRASPKSRMVCPSGPWLSQIVAEKKTPH